MLFITLLHVQLSYRRLLYITETTVQFCILVLFSIIWKLYQCGTSRRQTFLGEFLVLFSVNPFWLVNLPHPSTYMWIRTVKFRHFSEVPHMLLFVSLKILVCVCLLCSSSQSDKFTQIHTKWTVVVYHSVTSCGVLICLKVCHISFAVLS